MKRTLLAALAVMAIATVARAQELPDYPIRNDIDQAAYDWLATSWDSDSPTVRQCALDSLNQRHITKTYPNLLAATGSCGLAEDRKKEIDENE
jgi:hypothetical protein